MQKTTLYLSPHEINHLKKLAAKKRGVSVASLIRQAIADFLTKSIKHSSVSYLRKHLSSKVEKTSSFQDPVAFQKNIRGEWE